MQSGLSAVERTRQIEQVRAQVAKVKDPALTVDASATELPLGIPAAYWLDLRGYDPPFAAAGLAKPVLVLQGGRDYQFTTSDYDLWQGPLARRAGADFKLYPDLNHLFMTGSGKSTPAEYEIAGHVAAPVHRRSTPLCRVEHALLTAALTPFIIRTLFLTRTVFSRVTDLERADDLEDGMFRKGGGALGNSPVSPAARSVDLPGSRVRRQARTREEIVRVAQEVILDVGQDAFSLREVARRADYAPSALYKYFEDKDALIGAVANEALQILGSYMGAVPADLSPGERVVRLAEAYLCYAEEHPRHFALIFGRLVAGVPSWEVYVQVAWPFTLVVDACRAGVECGAFRVRPGFGPAEMALGCWSLIHGAAALLRNHLNSLQTELRPAVREACRTYVRGLMSDAHESGEARPQ